MNSGFGRYLKDYLEYYNISQSDFAVRLGISQKHMNEILNGKKDITLEMASNIGRLTNIPVEFIIKSEYRNLVTRELLEAYENEKNINEKMKKEFYLNELKERKWVDFKNITNAIQNYIDIMDFLKVKDLDSLVKVQEKTLFKKKGNDLNKLNLWIARADELSMKQKVHEYHKINFNFMIEDLKKIAFNNNFKNENNEYKEITEIQNMLNNYGIYFIVEKALSGTKVRGCFKVKGKNPAIYITKNYSGKDSFYFELFHELGHCKSDYNEAKSKVIVDANEEQEKRADEFALDMMIDKMAWKEIEIDYCENNLLKISNKYKIPMSFFVGRLAKLRKITYSSELYNKYKLQ